MANRTTPHNPLAVARRQLSELEREAITGAPLPDTEPQATITRGFGVLARPFASALYHDSIAVISGIASVLSGFAAAYFAFVSQNNIAILWLIALVSMIVASYRIWAKERRALLEAQGKLLTEQTKNAKPEIKGEVIEVYDKWAIPAAKAGTDTSLDYFFTIKARIYNVRPVPTTVRFELWLQAPRANCKANRSSLSGLFLRREEHATGTLSRTARMQLVTEALVDLDSLGRTPLAMGEEREGWLRFVLNKANNPIKKDIQSLHLVIRDIYGGTHMIPSDISEWYQSGQILTQFDLDLEEQKLKDLHTNLL